MLQTGHLSDDDCNNLEALVMVLLGKDCLTNVADGGRGARTGGVALNSRLGEYDQTEAQSVCQITDIKLDYPITVGILSTTDFGPANESCNVLFWLDSGDEGVDWEGEMSWRAASKMAGRAFTSGEIEPTRLL